MFRQSLLESVKARLLHPQLQALPLHARIQRAIRQLILDGALAPGNPLPASRALAQSLGYPATPSKRPIRTCMPRASSSVGSAAAAWSPRLPGCPPAGAARALHDGAAARRD
ncbi:GntR family transcriptional regulator [Pseudomonas aeruginosa PA99]|nr:GntR family transcriptional regulator [Pseudomonas aeruginosa PA99]